MRIGSKVLVALAASFVVLATNVLVYATILQGRYQDAWALAIVYSISQILVMWFIAGASAVMRWRTFIFCTIGALTGALSWLVVFEGVIIHSRPVGFLLMNYRILIIPAGLCLVFALLGFVVGGMRDGGLRSQDASSPWGPMNRSD